MDAWKYPMDPFFGGMPIFRGELAVKALGSGTVWHNPRHPCMVYLPAFTIHFHTNVYVNIPYMDPTGKKVLQAKRSENHKLLPIFPSLHEVQRCEVLLPVTIFFWEKGFGICRNMDCTRNRYISGQKKKYHQPRFSWKSRGFPETSATFWGQNGRVRSPYFDVVSSSISLACWMFFSSKNLLHSPRTVSQRHHKSKLEGIPQVQGTCRHMHIDLQVKWECSTHATTVSQSGSIGSANFKPKKYRYPQLDEKDAGRGTPPYQYKTCVYHICFFANKHIDTLPLLLIPHPSTPFHHYMGSSVSSMTILPTTSSPEHDHRCHSSAGHPVTPTCYNEFQLT